VARAQAAGKGEVGMPGELVAGFRTPDDPAWTRSELDNKELMNMASSGKRKTTMAKLTRESRLRERRLDKQAKKDARKLAPAHPPSLQGDPPNATTGESYRTDTGEPAPECVIPARPNA
jgi:hypothetical protein